MKGEDLFIALGKIDDKFIEDAAPKKAAFYQKNTFKWAVAAAACLCVFVLGYCVTSVLTARDGNLPEIDYAVHFDGMGYEGTDELSMKNSDDINPWNENVELDTLPVYKNLRYNGGKLSQTYYSALDLKAQTETFANAMGLDIMGGEAVYGEEEDEVYNYILQTQQGTVSTNGTGISFNIKKGFEHMLNRHVSYCFGSETEKVSGVYRKYSADGEVFDEEKRSYYKYGDITDNIVNFNLKSHWQDSDEDYTGSRSDSYLNCSEKLGNYPIITLKEAKEKLLSGEYVTSADESNVQGGKLSEDVIAKTDLIYYTVGNQKFYMPYYRFYVKYYSGGDIQQYAYFYVSAVEDKYLGESNTFDGSFQ